MSQQVVVATPADMDLQEDPIRANWIIDGDPKARSKRLATSEDGTSWIVTWSCTAGDSTGIISSTRRCTSCPEELLLQTRRVGNVSWGLVTWHSSRRERIVYGM
jgi:hypothetical protein